MQRPRRPAGILVVVLAAGVIATAATRRTPPVSPTDARQAAYAAAVFRDRRVYTPQLVVDGRLEAIGSDASAVRRAVVEAARQPTARLDASTSAEGSGRLRVHVRVQVPSGVARQGAAEVVLAVIENGLATNVVRGENGGRTLRHAAVTRSLSTIGALDATTAETTVQAIVPLSPTWSVADLGLVCVLQERDSRRILGATAVGFDPATARVEDRR